MLFTPALQEVQNAEPRVFATFPSAQGLHIVVAEYVWNWPISQDIQALAPSFPEACLPAAQALQSIEWLCSAM